MDSCVCIDLIERRSPIKTMYIRPIWDSAKHGQINMLVSTLAIFEVGKIRDDDGKSEVDADWLSEEDAEERIAEFFDSEYVHPYAMDELVARRARQLRRQVGESKLEKIDAMHLATALIHNCNYFITVDGDTPTPKPTAVLKLNGLIEPQEKEIALQILTPKSLLRERAGVPSAASSIAAKDSY